MTYLLTAWNSSQIGPIHIQHLATTGGLQRLINLLIDQTECDSITVRIIPHALSDPFQLALPSCTTPT